MRLARLSLLMFAAFVVACSPKGERASSPATTVPAAEAPRPGGALPEPDPALTDEKAALAEVDASWPTEQLNGEAGPAKKVLFDALSKKAPLTDASLAVFAPAFRGEDLAAREATALGEPSGISLGAWKQRPADLDAAGFVEAFNRYLAEFERVTAFEQHTWELQIAEGLPEDQVGLEAVEAIWVVGRTPDGGEREDRFSLVLDLRKPKDAEGTEWKLAGVRTEEGRTARAPRAYFVDITDAALPGGYDQIGASIYTDGGPTLADFDGDGDVDLFLPRQHAPARLYANDGSGHFDDVTLDWALETQELGQGTNSAVFFDYDNDGRLDLVVGRKEQGARLFHNEGGYFEDVTGAFDLLGPGQWQTLAVADYDGDGYPDIYAANYNLIDTKHQPASYVDARDGLPNVLLRNLEGTGRFAAVTEAAGLDAGNDRWSYVAAWADYDVDGDMDLYVANDYGPSQLYRNGGDGTFEEVSDAVGAQDAGNGMGASWLDYDNDGLLDLYKSNMQSFAGNRITRLRHFPGTDEQRAIYRRFSQGNTLLRNMGDGSFQDVTDEAGVRAGFFAWGNLGFDYDSDGDMDIFNNAGFYTGSSTADT